MSPLENSTPYPFMNLYPLGVPLSEKRKETWCVVMGISEMKSQNMSGSFRWVAGFRFCVWIKFGNRIGSLKCRL